jgi:hypothetical protein
MDLQDKLEQYKTEMKQDIQHATDAEQNDEQTNHGQQNVAVSKNTHFEYELGGQNNPKLTVYIERLDTETGLNILFWVEKDWFTEDQLNEDWPELPDNEVTKAINKIRTLVEDTTSTQTTHPQYMQTVGKWLIYEITCYF